MATNERATKWRSHKNRDGVITVVQKISTEVDLAAEDATRYAPPSESRQKTFTDELSYQMAGPSAARTTVRVLVHLHQYSKDGYAYNEGDIELCLDDIVMPDDPAFGLALAQELQHWGEALIGIAGNLTIDRL